MIFPLPNCNFRMNLHEYLKRFAKFVRKCTLNANFHFFQFQSELHNQEIGGESEYMFHDLLQNTCCHFFKLQHFSMAKIFPVSQDIKSV